MAVKASRKFKTEQKYARAGFYRTTNQSIHCNSKRLGIVKDVTGRVDGADNRSRTYDLRITNALLYQLSYIGIEPGLRGKPEVR